MEDRALSFVMETQESTQENTTADQLLRIETHDDAAEHFQCVICLELVYKPIVHACGHLFCFWCVHRAMNDTFKNMCPLCRQPYMHFPRICEQLHFVLLKAVHDKYILRAQEVLEEEVQGGIFSPELHPVPRIREETPGPSEESSSTGRSDSASSLSVSSSCNSGDVHHQNLLKDSSVTQDPSLSTFKGKALMLEEGERKQESSDSSKGETNPGSSDASNSVKVADLACLRCNQLLYRAVVLNCGHIFCEQCVEIGDNDSVACPTCKADHPGMFPQVCLELHHYIDSVFPLEYAQRSLQVAPRPRALLLPSGPEDSVKGSLSKALPGPVHCAIGCDGCGMMPIVGKRFQCQECPKTIGFDLCEKCFDSGILLGRFNQGHTSEHCMLEVPLPGRGSSIARRFLDVMRNRSLNIMDDLRAVANDCNAAEARQVLLLPQHPVNGNKGTSRTESVAQATSVAPLVMEEGVETPSENDAIQDGDADEDDHLLNGFLYNEDGDDDEDDFDDAFICDNEEIDFFRVDFPS